MPRVESSEAPVLLAWQRAQDWMAWRQVPVRRERSVPPASAEQQEWEPERPSPERVAPLALSRLPDAGAPEVRDGARRFVAN